MFTNVGCFNWSVPLVRSLQKDYAATQGSDVVAEGGGAMLLVWLKTHSHPVDEPFDKYQGKTARKTERSVKMISELVAGSK